MPRRKSLSRRARRRLVRLTNRILVLVDDGIARWKFDVSLTPELLGASGLSHSQHLLRDALRLADKSGSPGSNILVRSAFEFWVIGTWVTFEGWAAYFAVERKRIAEERKLARASGDDPLRVERLLQHLAEDWDRLTAMEKLYSPDVKIEDVSIEEASKRIGPLIEARLGESADGSVIYNVLYRAHSTFDAHPYKRLAQPVVVDSSDLASVGPLTAWIDPVMVISQMAMYVGILGRWMDEVLNTPSPAWDKAVQQLADCIQSM